MRKYTDDISPAEAKEIMKMIYKSEHCHDKQLDACADDKVKGLCKTCGCCIVDVKEMRERARNAEARLINIPYFIRKIFC